MKRFSVLNEDGELEKLSSNSINMPYIKLRLRDFDVFVKSVEELTKLAKKFRIKALHYKQHYILIQREPNLLIVYKDQVIKDFTELYKMSREFTRRDLPVMETILEWRGVIEVYLTRPNVRTYVGVVAISYILILLFVLYTMVSLYI